MSELKTALFLDRDGVICEDRVDFVKSWEEFIFTPNAASAIKQANEAGLFTAVITNQSAISRRIFTVAELDEIHGKMVEELGAKGAKLDAIYYCPHDNHDNCDCRKPKSGMLFRAAKEHDIDLVRSFMIGDSLRDLVAANGAGVTPVIVLTGRGPEQLVLAEAAGVKPAYVARDIADAVDYVLAELKRRSGEPVMS